MPEELILYVTLAGISQLLTGIMLLMFDEKSIYQGVYEKMIKSCIFGGVTLPMLLITFITYKLFMYNNYGSECDDYYGQRYNHYKKETKIEKKPEKRIEGLNTHAQLFKKEDDAKKETGNKNDSNPFIGD